MGRPQKLQEIVPGFWHIIQRFRPYIRQEWRLIILSLIALLAEVGLRLMEPWPLKIIFDGVIEKNPIHKHFPSFLTQFNQPSQLIILAAIALVVISLFRALASYFNTIGFALIGNRVLTQVRRDLYCHLQSLSLSFHNQAKGGDLTIRIISDVGLLKDVVVTALLPMVGNFLILVGMVGLMFWLNTELTLLVIATIPLFWFSTTSISHKIRKVSRQERRREGAMAATAAESMNAIKIVQTFSLEKVFAQTFSSHNQRSLKDGVKTKRLAASLERTVDILIAIATALVLARGTQLVLEQSMSPGDLLVFLAYLKNAFKPLRDFAKYTGRLAKATAAGERILDLLDRQPEIVNLPSATIAPLFQGAITFDRVSFAYEAENPILREINLTIQPGEKIALVGYSGGGKSTLVSLLLRFYEPCAGSIAIDGKDIREYTLESLRSQITVVLQESLLFGTTIEENISYGKENATKEEIIEAAKLANAHEFIMNLPLGYETVLAEGGATLSGGQKQRIAIARAAIRKSPILILDEPTTGLDGKSEKVVVEALEKLAVEKTTVMITHDLDLAARSDVIVYLENGTIREKGSHQELLQQNGAYATLYRLQDLTRESSSIPEHNSLLIES
jgi:ATP-binding cassette subfamily B protein